MSQIYLYVNTIHTMYTHTTEVSHYVTFDSFFFFFFACADFLFTYLPFLD